MQPSKRQLQSLQHSFKVFISLSVIEVDEGEQSWAMSEGKERRQRDESADGAQKTISIRIKLSAKRQNKSLLWKWETEIFPLLSFYCFLGFCVILT